MSTAPPAEVDYVALDGSPQFRELRRAKRGFCIPLAIVGGLWFVGYAVGAMFAPELYATPVAGSINLGVVLGVGQFVTTFAITAGYIAFMNSRIDPKIEAVRAAAEPAGKDQR